MSYHTQRRVEFRETDAAGIAHFSTFFGWMESAEHEALRSLEMSVMPGDGNDISWPRVSSKCDFKNPIRFEEIADIEVRITRLGEKSVTYEFEISCQDRPVATGSMTSVCCRLSDKGIESISIPEDIRQRLQKLTDD